VPSFGRRRKSRDGKYAGQPFTSGTAHPFLQLHPRSSAFKMICFVVTEGKTPPRGRGVLSGRYSIDDERGLIQIRLVGPDGIDEVNVTKPAPNHRRTDCQSVSRSTTPNNLDADNRFW
jgi:hypothetical protein